MAITNPYSKSWAFPWLSLEETNKIKEQAKSMTDDPYEQMLIQDDLYKKKYNTKAHENFMSDRQNARMELHIKSNEAKDEKTKNTNNSLDKMGTLADMYRQYGFNHGKNWDNIPDDELVSRFNTKNPSVKKYADAYLTWWPESEYRLAQELGIANGLWKSNEAKDENNVVDNLVVGWEVIGGAAALDASLNALGRWAKFAWKTVYNAPIDSSKQEALQIQRTWAAKRDAKIAVKNAKKDLKTAKKLETWIAEAEENLAKAEKDLAKAEWKEVVKVADSAREYNVWGGLTEWWTAESRGIQARSEANQIFKQTIEPALEKSTAKVNVQELINSLEKDIVDLAKNDPDKLKAYGEALDSLKESYADPKFAEYTLKDTQVLKSWLQGRTPQKFWKWNEITNELQELKWKLSSKLTNAVHDNLTNELWEESWKLYRHYANLTQYADDMARASTNWWLKWGFWNLFNTVYHKLTDWGSAKVGLLLEKTGNAVEKATNPKVRVEATSKLIKKVKKDPKILTKWLKAIAPWDLLMPDYSYDTVNEKGWLNPWWDKLKERVDKNWGTELTENEWKGLLWEEWYNIIDENGKSSLEEKWWTPEGILALMDILE